ncbi:hypothetical protein IGI04_026251 [Brassica rapa subsp. trilocularis]|uniref:Uncharacterized protein n=1 Tax=Brassica rapa subsp. trilocularis TaxID=1813537 RepID=A0ABQ7KVQ5_BRACM|nr:hypothetical protein IGI04_026251 [Brassica rapa subsp. trilocularis]
MAATKMVFHHMVLIFQSFKDASFSNLDLDMQVFQIWKTFELEDFQTTFRKSSDRVFNQMIIIFHLDMYVFQTTSKKSSRRFPGSPLTGSSSISSGSSRKSQISDTIRSNAKLTRFPYTTYMEVVLIFFLTNKDGRLPCKSSRKTYLKVNCKTNLCIDHKTSMKSSGRTDLEKKINFKVSTSEITCLAHKIILQAPKISNKSDPPRIISFNGSMNHKNFRIKILVFWMNMERKCIKSFKLVVHGG